MSYGSEADVGFDPLSRHPSFEREAEVSNVSCGWLAELSCQEGTDGISINAEAFPTIVSAPQEQERISMRHENHQIASPVFSNCDARVAPVRSRVIARWVLDIDVDPVGLDKTAAHFLDFSRNLLAAPRGAECSHGRLVLLHVSIGFAFKLTLKGC